MGAPYAEVIGDPIGHSKSPLIHKFWLRQARLDGDYRAVRVPPAGLADYLAERRRDPDWRGCNVTIPHKTSISGLLDRVADQGIGAVNCVIPAGGTLTGLNSDSDGAAAAVGRALDPESAVCLLGAGGGAAAAVAGLGGLGARRFQIVVRDSGRGQALLDRLGVAGNAFGFDQAPAAIAAAAGLVNASPLGMQGFPAMPESVLAALPGLEQGAFVFDMVYAPIRTFLLERAQAAGFETIDGLAMLVAQAARAFELFFGVAAPRERDDELRALLVR